jgi:hypothetical protein
MSELGGRDWREEGESCAAAREAGEVGSGVGNLRREFVVGSMPAVLDRADEDMALTKEGAGINEVRVRHREELVEASERARRARRVTRCCMRRWCRSWI